MSTNKKLNIVSPTLINALLRVVDASLWKFTLYSNGPVGEMPDEIQAKITELHGKQVPPRKFDRYAPNDQEVAVAYVGVNDRFFNIREAGWSVTVNEPIFTLPKRYYHENRIRTLMWDSELSCSRFAKNFGWEIIEGLYNPYMLSLHYDMSTNVVLPWNGYHLIPPIGVWPADLPKRMKGEFVYNKESGSFRYEGELISEGWIDIFEYNQEILVQKGKIAPSRDEDFNNFSYLYLPEKNQAWTVHNSVQGMRQLLWLIYQEPEKTFFVADKDRSIATMVIPEKGLGQWIGAGGHQAKKIAEMVGVEQTNIYSYDEWIKRPAYI